MKKAVDILLFCQWKEALALDILHSAKSGALAFRVAVKSGSWVRYMLNYHSTWLGAHVHLPW